ncbi:hypothetical protein E7T06_10500 [Deinococcus sp. Arct2-2]|uniref:hypothetical protein n=1 Tax=Deinococcus sp. Arct2-2 TaxID=2568653 RepID=UPI0010A309D7|nr:hypothetical protein [Deinococcus sp. Arct2-2]THF69798.1 hypothetical protein E7T06_10500 [Deinococcus sp. Arct2-2]
MCARNASPNKNGLGWCCGRWPALHWLSLFADALGIAHLRGWIVGAFFVGEVLIYGALDKAEG